MTSLAEILHNVADHTDTLLKLINEPTLAADISERLRRHILLEEQENTERLQQLHALKPTIISQKLLDHSFLLQRMLEEDGMSLELKRELLDHFMEEHQAWAAELPPEQAERQWTVGPLWPQGG